MLPIEWRASAEDDLLQIMDFISGHDEQAAERLFAQIERDIEHAAEHPYIYKQSQRVIGLREIVTHPNYLILYQLPCSLITEGL
jgi:plasmid stabilization system protein ParE